MEKKTFDARQYPANERVSLVDWVIENDVTIARCAFCRRKLRIRNGEAVPCDCSDYRAAEYHNQMVSWRKTENDASRFSVAHRLAEQRRLAEEALAEKGK
jgi:hypothetical protein